MFLFKPHSPLLCPSLEFSRKSVQNVCLLRYAFSSVRCYSCCRDTYGRCHQCRVPLCHSSSDLDSGARPGPAVLLVLHLLDVFFFVEVQPFWPGCHQHNCENVSVAVGFLWPQQFYRVWRLEQKPGGGGLNQITCQICLGCIQWHLRKRYQGDWSGGGKLEWPVPMIIQ